MKLRGFVGGILGAALLVTVGLAQGDLAKIAKLRNPAALNETAPATFKVNLETTKGPIVILVTREWAPLGADRFYNLVKNGFYDEAGFFRVVPGFMVQFGINANPAVTSAWRAVPLKDDLVKKSNRPGYVTFAKTSAPNSRGTQLFINYKDNSFLDSMGFAPIGQVVQGMDIANKINSQYQERPDQGLLSSQGNAYLQKDFPKLDYIKAATIVE